MTLCSKVLCIMNTNDDGQPELIATHRSAGKNMFSVDIVVVYHPRYRFGHEADFVPPITGIHLAAITPPAYQVRVIHQQVEPVDFETDADLIALSFFTGFATEAYRLAHEFRMRGKRVLAGGPHVTFNGDERLSTVTAW